MRDSYHPAQLGEPGKTLFYYPFDDVDTLQDVKELGTYLRALGNAKDDRLFVVMCALVAEQYVDKMLELLIPDYDKGLRNRFTFSLKLDLLEAYRIIPEHIISSGRTVNEIRNAFAHELRHYSFKDLDQRLIDKIKTQEAKSSIHLLQRDDQFVRYSKTLLLSRYSEFVVIL
jgi:hypothetical protein